MKVRHKITESGLRRRKLFAHSRWILGAALLSIMVWYLAVALGLTGHTKIIWGARKVRDKLHLAEPSPAPVDNSVAAPASKGGD